MIDERAVEDRGENPVDGVVHHPALGVTDGEQPVGSGPTGPGADLAGEAVDMAVGLERHLPHRVPTVH